MTDTPDGRPGDHAAPKSTTDPTPRPSDPGVTERVASAGAADTPTDPDEPGEASDPAAAAWAQLLSVIGELGTATGRDAADRWAQDTLGGRPARTVTSIASQVLAGLDHGDPAVLDALPTWRMPGEDATADPTGAYWWEQTAPPDAPGWTSLTDDQQDQALMAYDDAYTAAAQDLVGWHCRTALGPGGPPPGPRPGGLARGHVAVFADTWTLYTPAGPGSQRHRVGFVGTLIERWNGWAVFTCTRPVAEAIVAAWQSERDNRRRTLIADGATEQEATRVVDAAMMTLRFEADRLIIDQRVVSGNPDHLFEARQGLGGGWVVAERDWTWRQVHPNRCDRIVGDLPPGQGPNLVAAVHTPGLLLPPTGLRMWALPPRGAEPETTYLALIERRVYGPTQALVGMVWDDPSWPEQVDWEWAGGRFGDQEMAAWARACRWRGHPLGVGQAIGLLFREALAARDATRTVDLGGTLVRMLHADGSIGLVTSIWPAPATLPAQARMVRQLAEQIPGPVGGSWQLWISDAWVPVTAARTANLNPVATTGDPQPTPPPPPSQEPPSAPPAATADDVYPGLDAMDRDQLIGLAAREGLVLYCPDLDDGPGPDQREMRERIRRWANPAITSTPARS